MWRLLLQGFKDSTEAKRPDLVQLQSSLSVLLEAASRGMPGQNELPWGKART